MKELVRFAGYSAATAAIIMFIIFMARFDDASGTFLVVTAIVVVIILPVLIGVFMGRREHARRAREESEQK
jgi:ABC-type proline/glycine betaine transport system permease subunit